jgi:hypothetical protein
MSSTDNVKTQFLNRAVGVIFVLAPLPLLLVVLVYRYCRLVTSPHEGRHTQFGLDVEKKTNKILDVLVSHVITESDLSQADEESKLDDFNLIVDGTSINYPETTEAPTDEESLYEKEKSSTAIIQNRTDCAAVDAEEYLSSAVGSHDKSQPMAAVGTFSLPSCCSICLDDFVEGDLICWSKIPSCTHIFHQQCLLPWLVIHDSCPSCRCNIFSNSKSSCLSPNLP